jgi:DNA-binding transcriptional ArsR family regulator
MRWKSHPIVIMMLELISRLRKPFVRFHILDIYIKLRLEQSVASQHLAILRRAGVVLTERHGKFIYYSLDNDRLAQISRLVEELAG